MALNETILKIAGRSARLLRDGPSSDPVLFIHGGVPGQTPYCSSADLWGDVLGLFAAHHVIALDMPGSGASEAPPGDWLTIEAFGQHALATTEALKIDRCHVVGHDDGALVGLWLAMEAPRLVRSVTVVASPTAAPSGDGVPNLTLAYPPHRLWSRASQAWALDRISFAPHHVTEDLLQRCVHWAEAAPHRGSAAALKDPAVQLRYAASVMRAKARLFEQCRGSGIAAPVQLVWGTHDPLTTIDHGITLYGIVAAKQTAAQFHVMNRVGSLLFREDPRGFHKIVTAFHDGLANG